MIGPCSIRPGILASCYPPLGPGAGGLIVVLRGRCVKEPTMLETQGQVGRLEAEVVELHNAVQALLRLVEERLPGKQSEPSRPALTLVKGKSDA